jgi:hypothetical protein
MAQRVLRAQQDREELRELPELPDHKDLRGLKGLPDQSMPKTCITMILMPCRSLLQGFIKHLEQ